MLTNTLPHHYHAAPRYDRIARLFHTRDKLGDTQMHIDNFKKFAEKQGIKLESQDTILSEATNNVTSKYRYSVDDIKASFDSLLDEIEQEAYRVYLGYELAYGKSVFRAIMSHFDIKESTNISDAISTVLGDHFAELDYFFLSLAQGRKARAGKTFEGIHNSLFKTLGYPFDEQQVINGKPDFILPSVSHYHKMPMDCIIFTAKRTLRERWRQIVTEGAKGLGFFLATIDENLSSNQLDEMLNHRIYLVCPSRIKSKHYRDSRNVLSFNQFFVDFVDPAMDRWKRNGVIPNG